MSQIGKYFGIVGGSQLAAYLANEARKMSFIVIGLSEKNIDPAFSWLNLWIKGKPQSFQDLKKLLKPSDLVFFENPYIFDLLKNGLVQPEHIHPSPQLNLKWTDLWTQKELLEDFNIPQIPYIKINGKDDLDEAFLFFKKNMVLKNRIERKNIPDTFFIKNSLQLNRFKLAYKGFESHFIAEPFIRYQTEHRLVLARNEKNQFCTYPLFQLENDQNENYDLVIARDQIKISSNLDQLIKSIKKLLEQTNYKGIATFNLIKHENQYYVTDVNTRPTNSGMITLNGFSMNQFELHIKACLNHSLPQKITMTDAYAVCKYLNGTKKRIPQINKALYGHLHWYNKKNNQSGRKMGHINYTGSNLNELIRLSQLDRKGILI